MVFVVVDAEGCFDAAALGLPSPKDPSFLRDSAARESDVTVPTPSWMGLRVDSGSVVTWWARVSHCLHMEIVSWRARLQDRKRLAQPGFGGLHTFCPCDEAILIVFCCY